MEIQMRDLRDGPLDVKIDESPEKLELKDKEFRFPEQVTGEIRLQTVGPNVVMRGHVQTKAETSCVRCLKPVNISIRGEVNVAYENNPDLLKPDIEFLGAEEEGLTYFDGIVVTPNPQLREALMVELPMLPVCSEDCKGLCPGCGVDLNIEECRCSSDSQAAGTWKDKLKGIKLE